MAKSIINNQPYTETRLFGNDKIAFLYAPQDDTLLVKAIDILKTLCVKPSSLTWESIKYARAVDFNIVKVIDDFIPIDKAVDLCNCYDRSNKTDLIDWLEVQI